MLARSRYLLFKAPNKWTPKQAERAAILFELYPELKKAYHLCLMFRNIYEKANTETKALEMLDQWCQKVYNLGFESFITAANSIKTHKKPFWPISKTAAQMLWRKTLTEKSRPSDQCSGVSMILDFLSTVCHLYLRRSISIPHPLFLLSPIRTHWGIENNLHWSLDVVFNEDASRKRARNAAFNFSIINRMALSLLKKDDTKISLKAKRLLAGLENDYVLKVLNF